MKRRTLCLAGLSTWVCSPLRSQTAFSLGIATSGLSIGIHLPAYPQLSPLPGYPVYYAPSLRLNYFFYDGLYWVFQSSNWYVSAWYNGPWNVVAQEAVPLAILRIPVRYYRLPPPAFRGWNVNQPPRWGEHWGPEWESHRQDWSQWNQQENYPPAPLPQYQRDFSGNRYPAPECQPRLREQYDRYEPREPVVRQHLEQQRADHGRERGKSEGHRNDRRD